MQENNQIRSCHRYVRICFLRHIFGFARCLRFYIYNTFSFLINRSFVVWHDEDEYKYVELQNIEPPRTEMKNMNQL